MAPTDNFVIGANERQWHHSNGTIGAIVSANERQWRHSNYIKMTVAPIRSVGANGDCAIGAIANDTI